MEKSDNDLGAIDGTPPSPSPTPLSEGTGGEESWGSTDSRTPNPRPTKIIRMDSSNPPPPPPPPEMAVEEAPTPTPIAEDESTVKPADMSNHQNWTHLLHAQNPDLDDEDYGETPIGNFDSVNATQIPAQSRKAGRQVNFSVADDKLMVSGWINVSQDPIVGHDQKGAAFWQRITDYFNYHRIVGKQIERTLDSIKGRWKKMQKCVTQFNACFAEIERLNASGTNDVDKLNRAKALFVDNHGCNFVYEHCWLILKDEQKWLHSVTPDMSSPTEMGSASINAGDERPIGRKAAKAAKRTASDVTGPSKMSEQRFEDYQDLKVKMHNEKLEVQREQARMAKQKMEFEMKKYEREEDERVLRTDTSRMEPGVAHWFQCRKMEIMEKYNQGGGT